MITNETSQVLDQPKLIDATIATINTKLLTSLSWLGNAYGRCKRRRPAKDDSVRPKYRPTVPGQGLEEIVLFPDQHLGNHCFFYLLDGHEINADVSVMKPTARTRGSIIFWYDIRDVYPSDWATRNDMNVARDVLEILRTMTVQRSVLVWTAIHVEPQNVYAGFSWEQVDEIHYMRPKGCFRIEGIFFHDEARC